MQRMRNHIQRLSRFIRNPWPGARTLQVVELGEEDPRGTWLAFFAATERFCIKRRRLRPVPERWHELTDQEVVQLFSAAVPVRGPYRGERLRDVERRIPFPESQMPQHGSADWHALMQLAELEYYTLALELLDVRAELTAISRSLTDPSGGGG